MYKINKKFKVKSKKYKKILLWIKIKIDFDVFSRYPSFGRSLYNPMSELHVTNPDPSSTSPLNPSRVTPKPIKFGVKGTCKKCPEGNNFLQITSTMNNEGDALAEFYDAHNEAYRGEHLFEGRHTIWELKRPEAACEGPDATTRACVSMVRSRGSKARADPQARQGHKA